MRAIKIIFKVASRVQVLYLSTFLTIVFTTNGFCQSPILDSDVFSADTVPVSESRIFVVPVTSAEDARLILGGKIYKKIDQDILQQLFPGRQFNTADLMGKQIAAAEEFAAKRESDADKPVFSTQSEQMKKRAKAHRDLAQYSKNVINQLHPYLVAGKGSVLGDGNFHAMLDHHTLKLVYSWLGAVKLSDETIPIVVFLERPIDRVESGLSGAD